MKKVLTTLLVILVLILGVGMFLPKDYSLSRSTVIQGSTADIHALVGDLARWPEWTPFAEEDETIQVERNAVTTGVGAEQSWSGESGSGHLKFTKCDPATGIAYDMEFLEGGKEYPAKSQMTYAPAAGGTEVTWSMNGSMDMPLGGLFKYFMTGSVGGMFDRGLEKLKQKVEAGG